METFRGHVYRLRLTKPQQERLGQWVGATRFVYNLALEQRRTWGRPGRRFNFVNQGREITALRQEAEWLADVPRRCLDQALRELDGAYRNWWAGTAAFPTFRSRARNSSVHFSNPADLGFRRTGRKTGLLRVPKIGWVGIRFDRPLVGELRSITLVERGGLWFASCLQRIQAPKQAPENEGAVGIDRGIRVFAALSSGEKVEGPNVGRHAARALAHAQRGLARKKKGSQNREKARLRVERLHMRVADARKDFLHKLSTTIAKSHGVVVMEDLRIGNMTRSAKGSAENPGRKVRQKAGLNRSILDQGWGAFKRMLAYKLAARGGALILVPAYDTSRTCAMCGAVDAASRSGARFTCTSCGHTDDADLNAAINILRRRTPSMPVEGLPTWAPAEAGTSGRAA